MKNLILSTVVASTLLIPTFAQAGADDVDMCVSLGKTANQIMKFRQDDIRMDDFLYVINSQDKPKSVKVAQRAIVKMAYTQPLEPTAELKNLAASEFGINMYLACLSGE